MATRAPRVRINPTYQRDYETQPHNTSPPNSTPSRTPHSARRIWSPSLEHSPELLKLYDQAKGPCEEEEKKVQALHAILSTYPDIYHSSSPVLPHSPPRVDQIFLEFTAHEAQATLSEPEGAENESDGASTTHESVGEEELLDELKWEFERPLTPTIRVFPPDDVPFVPSDAAGGDSEIRPEPLKTTDDSSTIEPTIEPTIDASEQKTPTASTLDSNVQPPLGDESTTSHSDATPSTDPKENSNVQPPALDLPSPADEPSTSQVPKTHDSTPSTEQTGDTSAATRDSVEGGPLKTSDVFSEANDISVEGPAVMPEAMDSDGGNDSDVEPPKRTDKDVEGSASVLPAGTNETTTEKEKTKDEEAKDKKTDKSTGEADKATLGEEPNEKDMPVSTHNQQSETDAAAITSSSSQADPPPPPVPPKDPKFSSGDQGSDSSPPDTSPAPLSGDTAQQQGFAAGQAPSAPGKAEGARTDASTLSDVKNTNVDQTRIGGSPSSANKVDADASETVQDSNSGPEVTTRDESSGGEQGAGAAPAPTEGKTSDATTSAGDQATKAGVGEQSKASGGSVKGAGADKPGATLAKEASAGTPSTTDPPAAETSGGARSRAVRGSRQWRKDMSSRGGPGESKTGVTPLDSQEGTGGDKRDRAQGLPLSKLQSEGDETLTSSVDPTKKTDADGQGAKPVPDAGGSENKGDVSRDDTGESKTGETCLESQESDKDPKKALDEGVTSSISSGEMADAGAGGTTPAPTTDESEEKRKKGKGDASRGDSQTSGTPPGSHGTPETGRRKNKNQANAMQRSASLQATRGGPPGVTRTRSDPASRAGATTGGKSPITKPPFSFAAALKKDASGGSSRSWARVTASRPEPDAQPSAPEKPAEATDAAQQPPASQGTAVAPDATTVKTRTTVVETSAPPSSVAPLPDAQGQESRATPSAPTTQVQEPQGATPTQADSTQPTEKEAEIKRSDDSGQKETQESEVQRQAAERKREEEGEREGAAGEDGKCKEEEAAAAERKRKEGEAVEMDRKRKEEELEKKRKEEAAEAERKRKEEAAEAERKRKEEEESERKRKEGAAEMERKQKEEVAELERKRKEAEAAEIERKQIMAEADRKRKEGAAEMERKQKEEVAELERKRKEEEAAEIKRKQKEETAEAERKGKEGSAEAERKQKEEGEDTKADAKPRNEVGDAMTSSSANSREQGQTIAQGEDPTAGSGSATGSHDTVPVHPLSKAQIRKRNRELAQAKRNENSAKYKDKRDKHKMKRQEQLQNQEEAARQAKQRQDAWEAEVEERMKAEEAERKKQDEEAQKRTEMERKKEQKARERAERAEKEREQQRQMRVRERGGKAAQKREEARQREEETRKKKEEKAMEKEEAPLNPEAVGTRSLGAETGEADSRAESASKQENDAQQQETVQQHETAQRQEATHQYDNERNTGTFGQAAKDRGDTDPQNSADVAPIGLVPSRPTVKAKSAPTSPFHARSSLPFDGSSRDQPFPRRASEIPTGDLIDLDQGVNPIPYVPSIKLTRQDVAPSASQHSSQSVETGIAPSAPDLLHWDRSSPLGSAVLEPEYRFSDVPAGSFNDSWLNVTSPSTHNAPDGPALAPSSGAISDTIGGSPGAAAAKSAANTTRFSPSMLSPTTATSGPMLLFPVSTLSLPGYVLATTNLASEQPRRQLQPPSEPTHDDEDDFVVLRRATYSESQSQRRRQSVDLNSSDQEQTGVASPIPHSLPELHKKYLEQRKTIQEQSARIRKLEQDIALLRAGMEAASSSRQVSSRTRRFSLQNSYPAGSDTT